MDLDSARRLDDSIRGDFDRMQAVHGARIATHDTEHVDPEACVATWSRGGAPLWDGKIELAARYSPELGVFRWWWALRVEALNVASRLDRAYSEAQRTELEIVLSRQIVLDDTADAEMLARVACHLGRAHGMIVRAEGSQLAYYALFESAASLERALSEPPPVRKPVLEVGDNLMRSMPPPAVAARPSQLPQERPVREPSIDLIVPVAQAAGTAVRRALGGSFQTAILVMVVDTSRDKARFYVQLVAVSQFGELEAPDTSRELLDAVSTFLVADAKSGNGRWRKLVVRVYPEGQGLGLGKIEVF